MKIQQIIQPQVENRLVSGCCLPRQLKFVIDWDGRLYGFEFKWSKPNSKPPALWLETYPEAGFEAIPPGNYPPFIA